MLKVEWRNKKKGLVRRPVVGRVGSHNGDDVAKPCETWSLTYPL